MKDHMVEILMVMGICLIISGCVNNIKTVKTEWESVATGQTHTCAIDTDNNLYCWGNNISGQLGDGTTEDHYRPELVNDKKWHSISAGANLTCGITTDSYLYCWGANYSGGTGTGSEEDYLTTPGKVGNMKWKSVKVLPAYHQSVCAITTEDELYCWGLIYSVEFVDKPEDSYYSRVPLKAGDYKWKKVEIGKSGGCGIDLNDELWCWGQYQYQVIDTESENADLPQKINDEKWIDISIYNDLYYNNTCAIRSDSTLFCWGGMESSTIFGDNKIMVSYDSGWKSVYAGRNDVCAIKNDDSLHCFGEHSEGKFYNGGREVIYEPVKVSSNKWKSLSSGYGFKCGILANNHLFCWGLNDYGQIGNGECGNKKMPDKINNANWDDISSGSIYTCGIQNKKLYCWGHNWGHLGDGTKISRQEPVKITDKNWKSVSGFSSEACAIDDNDKLFCWGDIYNHFSSEDSYENILITEPEQFDEEDWLQISNGEWYKCGIRSDNHIYCWGYNNSRQLGYENPEITILGTDTPHKLDDNEWKSVKAGGRQTTCGLNMDGLLFCWGNYLSQCQEETYDGSIRQISEIKWEHFDMNGETFCGINKDDDLYCWGFTGSGELGIGEFDDFYVCEPTKVGEKKWQNVSTGHQRTCGIDSEGNLYCWGINTSGLLGIDSGDKYYADTPQKVGNKKWTRISVGNWHACALDENEQLFCWGQNNYGQLGNGMAWIEDMYEVVSY